MHHISVILPTPAHARLPEVLSYRHSAALPLGSLVRVPLGARELLGVVWHSVPVDDLDNAALAIDKLKPIADVLAIEPLGAAWCKLISFAASYYQRYAGEIAMAALPPQLREMTDVQMARMLAKRAKKRKDSTSTSSVRTEHEASAEQTQVLAALATADTRPVLLFGATGSGKTEVYLRRVEALLAADSTAQALVMVPEINLTPQLESRFQARMEAQFGVGSVVLMHSGMTPAQRLSSWLSAHVGEARLVLGTRLAVLASMPNLRLIVVDEEHDPSYKSQDGSRYSARDLAVYRGATEGAQVILGSATPSIESWHNTLPKETQTRASSKVAAESASRYRRLEMPSRVSSAAMPAVRLLDMRVQPKDKLVGGVIALALMEAIEARIARGEQSLLFLNRRGYAPVLQCGSCEWKSDCPNCSAYQVFHKRDRRLRCHHCSLTTLVPRQCPLCGNLDIGTQGRGTEQLEELVVEALEARFKSEHHMPRVLRIDADSAKGKGTLEAQLASVHAGEVDVLVGTQMVTKGHDFRRITLVAAINPDSALFAADFRAPERLFSLLMQAAGRAGRDAAVGGAEMWLQTQHPHHALYQSLQKHDYSAFAASQLAERRGAAMPPFSYQALLRAEGKTQEAAQAFLDTAAAVAQSDPALAALLSQVMLYPAVPMPMQRIAGVERAQMLVESTSRAALQRMLTAWQPHLRTLKPAGVLRWALDVDPLSI
jgi:primosomal protein N' (replication factor Y) (superfamily II helicase)